MEGDIAELGKYIGVGLTAIGMGGIGHGILGHVDAPPDSRLQPGDRAQKRRLADPVGTAQDQCPTRRQGERDALDRPQSAARHGQIMDGQQIHIGSSAQATRRPSPRVTL